MRLLHTCRGTRHSASLRLRSIPFVFSELKIAANRARWFSLPYTKRWVLYAKCPFGGPQQVLSYLANYTHRVALSNRRIVAVDAQHQTVTFTYRDYRHGSQRKELTLAIVIGSGTLTSAGR
jgi:hypothetical protein